MRRPTPHPSGPGQESVWGYPRPPQVEPSDRRVRIVVAGTTVVDTTDAVRVLETSHPPTWYVPVASLRDAELVAAPGRSVCEFKGVARYWRIATADTTTDAVAWSYPTPRPGYETLRDRFTLYPGRVDACLVDDEVVRPQPGEFYGGWVTDDVTGPFKGGAGSWGW